MLKIFLRLLSIVCKGPKRAGGANFFGQFGGVWNSGIKLMMTVELSDSISLKIKLNHGLQRAFIQLYAVIEIVLFG